MRQKDRAIIVFSSLLHESHRLIQDSGGPCIAVALTRIKRRIDKTRGCDVKCSSFQLVSFSVMFVPSGDHMLRDAAFLSI